MENLTRKERIAYLKQNKLLEMQKKKSKMKEADGVAIDSVTTDKAFKQTDDDLEEKDELEARLIINTTNIMDSHNDVHIPGIWSKSLNESRNIMHLQEHQMQFDKIISDNEDLSASTKTMTWKSLGFDWSGKTEALLFKSTIRKERNEYMFEQYAKGRVNNHSVGMQYVKMLLAIDDKDEAQEYENWQKYIDQIVNREVAEEKGYFWIVKEAKVIEGSAVPLGSNFATPTQSVKDISEPFWDTLSKSVEPHDALDTFYKHLKF